MWVYPAYPPQVVVDTDKKSIRVEIWGHTQIDSTIPRMLSEKRMTLSAMHPSIHAMSNALARCCLSVSAHYVAGKIIPWSAAEAQPTGPL